jgi:hypothetical protein
MELMLGKAKQRTLSSFSRNSCCSLRNHDCVCAEAGSCPAIAPRGAGGRASERPARSRFLPSSTVLFSLEVYALGSAVGRFLPRPADRIVVSVVWAEPPAAVEEEGGSVLMRTSSTPPFRRDEDADELSWDEEEWVWEWEEYDGELS